MSPSYVATIFALLTIVAATEIVYAEEPKPDVAPPKSACPERLDGFANGLSSAEQIKTCLGQPPAHEDHNPDGRFVYLYNLKNGIAITYLFEPSGLLIRTNAYKKN
ncbi:MAG: hypothetical protein JWQ10_1488 [Herbaspirillum sp.]|nr:hypothetical protein [Herbaspirillum sp.]